MMTIRKYVRSIAWLIAAVFCSAVGAGIPWPAGKLLALLAIGAVILDTTNLSIEQVTEKILGYIEK